MQKLAVIALSLVALALAPGTARAQSYFSFFGGYSYDGAAGCPTLSDDCPNRPTGWGFAAGSATKVIGFEAEYAWTSDFFGKGGDLEDNKVTTLMTNVLVSIPLGPVRPYGAVGIGLMKAKMEFGPTELADFSDTSWGWDYGFGVMVLLPAHIGFRVDYRRFSSSAEIPYAGPIGRTNTPFEFSRATIGFVLH